jgi:hypothetical protein
MPAFPQRWLFVLSAVLTGAAHAAALPPDTLRELDAAAHQLERAALLRYVATDTTEAAHLLDARDHLRAAEPILRGPLRERVLRLDFDISRDAGAAAADLTVPPLDALGPVSVLPTLDRADLGTLAQRAEQIALQAQAG